MAVTNEMLLIRSNLFVAGLKFSMMILLSLPDVSQYAQKIFLSVGYRRRHVVLVPCTRFRYSFTIRSMQSCSR